MLLLNILAMGILGLIAWQDLTKKTIPWIIFPAGFVVFLMMGLIRLETMEYFINSFFNMLGDRALRTIFKTISYI